MDKLVIERSGGLAGFSGLGSKIRSRGELNLASLCPEDQAVVEQLFKMPAKDRAALKKASLTRDGFCYKISHTSKAGVQTIEAPEAAVPAALIQCVKDEFI
jgi:hypothetical protein